MLASWTSCEADTGVNMDADGPGTLHGLFLPKATVCDGEGPPAWHGRGRVGNTQEDLGVPQEQNCWSFS